MFTTDEMTNLCRAYMRGHADPPQDDINACAEWCLFVREAARRLEAIAQGQPGIIRKDGRGYNVELE